jgi:hypothetical protein
LVAALHGGDQAVVNRWPFWVFPAARLQPRRTVYLSEAGFTGRRSGDPVPELRQRYAFLKSGLPSGGEPAVLISGAWFEAQAAAQRGDRVLLLIGSDQHGEWPGVAASLGVSSRGPRPEHKYLLGTVIHDHPVLGDFPHEGWCDVQFLTGMTGGLFGIFIQAQEETRQAKPIVTLIPSPLDPEPRLACAVFELPVGKGTVLVCSFRFSGKDPAACYLLDRMLAWLDGLAAGPGTGGP